MFESFVKDKGKEIYLTREPTRHITEYMGVGAGLSLTKRIFNFTDADFSIIKETSLNKTLDYNYIASTGEKILEVETKGTHDGKSTYNQLKSIDEKKRDMRSHNDDDGNMMLIGTVFDIKYKSSKSKIILADPPLNKYGGDPKYIKVLNRLRYYYSELIKITPRSHLTVALINRIRVLEGMGEAWKKLDNIPLMNSYGDPLEISEGMADSIWLVDNTVVHGRIYDLRITRELFYELRDTEAILEKIRSMPQRLYFRGITHAILLSLAKQDFADISELKIEEGNIGIASGWDRYRTGRLERLSSGLLIGTFNQANWDTDWLPDIVEKLWKSI